MATGARLRAIRARGVRGKLGQPLILHKPGDVFGCALDQKRVAHRQRRFLEPCADGIALAVHRQRIDAEPAPPAQLAEAAPDRFRARPDQKLDRLRVAGLARFGSGEHCPLRCPAAQPENLAVAGFEHHRVPRLEPHRADIAPERGIAPDHVDHPTSAPGDGGQIAGRKPYQG